MGKKGGRQHLKRKPAPRFWPIHRKEYIWAIKPTPGPHAEAASLPLASVVRDILGYARTKKEAKTIISQGKILIDGHIRNEESFPVGLMDVISIPDAGENFRVLSGQNGLMLHPIEPAESTLKLCRIEDKTTVSHGSVQLNLHDGTNMLITVEDPKNPSEDLYETLNVLQITLPDREITGQLKLAKDAVALITGGQNRGIHGKIVDIEESSEKKRWARLATIEDATGKRFQTILDFIFPVGDAEKTISLPEVK
jgi:small subunit ribosomal protein S4e